jgi:transcription termination/antitermination protein NusG
MSVPEWKGVCVTACCAELSRRKWATTFTKCSFLLNAFPRSRRERKLYLLDEHNRLVDKSWYFVRETDGVLNFAGGKDHPIAMRPREVEAILAQVREREDSVIPKIAFSVGDSVRVADGPFESQTGIVEEIDPTRGVLRVAVNIFGRSTPVDLEYWQVEKA